METQWVLPESERSRRKWVPPDFAIGLCSALDMDEAPRAHPQLRWAQELQVFWAQKLQAFWAE